MPELPEVETVVRSLRPSLVGRRIVNCDIFWPKAFDQDPDLLRDRVIRRVSRRAKFILLELDRGTLLIHLRMTGRLTTHPPHENRLRYVTVSVDLDDGQTLYFEDTRKFGRWIYTENPGAILNGLGPEPLSPAFTARRLEEILEGRNRAIKPLLLDQTRIAGLGNIYVDEALFQAGIHPESRANAIPAKQVAVLHRKIRSILRRSIERQGTTVMTFMYGEGRSGEFQSQLRVYGRKDEPCPTCGSAIRKITLAQRGTHFCQKCQVRY